MTTRVRPVTAADADAWLRMRADLWPESGEAEHRAEIGDYLDGRFPRGEWRAFLAVAPDGPCGFAEVSMRPCAEGCTSSAVGYLEGWYVDAAHRRTGTGRALVAAAQGWARDRGCTEFASDADPDNAVSVAAHLALGFEDAGLVRCFRADLA